VHQAYTAEAASFGQLRLLLSTLDGLLSLVAVFDINSSHYSKYGKYQWQ